MLMILSLVCALTMLADLRQAASSAAAAKLIRSGSWPSSPETVTVTLYRLSGSYMPGTVNPISDIYGRGFIPACFASPSSRPASANHQDWMMSAHRHSSERNLNRTGRGGATSGTGYFVWAVLFGALFALWLRLIRHLIGTFVGGYLVLMAVVVAYYFGVAPGQAAPAAGALAGGRCARGPLADREARAEYAARLERKPTQHPSTRPRPKPHMRQMPSCESGRVGVCH